MAATNGVYAGRHRDSKVGTANSRIGYRHPDKGGGSVNSSFADGHARNIDIVAFPRGLGPANDFAVVREENLSGKDSVFANPEKALAIP